METRVACTQGCKRLAHALSGYCTKHVKLSWTASSASTGSNQLGQREALGNGYTRAIVATRASRAWDEVLLDLAAPGMMLYISKASDSLASTV